MDQKSDLKQWLDSQTVQYDSYLSPHHSIEEDFIPTRSVNDRPFVPSPKFKQEQYLWFEDGKEELPEMNLKTAKNQWTEPNSAGQIFMPFDLNGQQDHNGFEDVEELGVLGRDWEYFCPECGGNNVYEGPSSQNNNQIPDWESPSLVAKITEARENEQGDIDYCIDCESVWKKPALDFTVKTSDKLKLQTDYEKAKALWYKNAWESVQPVDTEADNSNKFKKAHMQKLGVARTCPQCYRSDSLVEVNKVDVYGYVSVDDQNVEWSDSDYGDDYEFVAAECSQCAWHTNSPHWVDELGYDNRKNAAKIAALISVDWDDDGEAVPSLVEVPFEVLQTELDGGGQVADWLSDNYGWSVNGWEFIDHPDDLGDDQSPLWHEGGRKFANQSLGEKVALYGHAEPDQWWFPESNKNEK